MSNELAGIQTAEAKKLFSAFIADKKVLLADPNGSARAGYAKTLISLGAKTNKILMVPDFSSAHEIVVKERPELIVSEYTMPGGIGLDLAQETRSYENQQEKVFVMVTGDSSQSVVAQAAEEDVDVFLIKPYTVNTFTDTIIKAVLQKIYPSEYIKVLEEGKKLLKAADLDGAIALFKKAETLNPKPSLAMFYQAEVEIIRKIFEGAAAKYKVGLQHNGTHFKCLNGLFNLLMQQKKTTEAYEVVKSIAKVFPSNPKRLSQILTLAVQTGNFEDIDTYYEHFRQMDVRSEELVKYVCAALVVAAKHMFRAANYARGVDLLKKASVSAAGRPNVLRQIVLMLLDNGFVPEAKTALDRFPSQTQSDPLFLVTKVLFQNAEDSDPRRAVSLFQGFMKGDVSDPLVHIAMIKRLKQTKKDDDAEDVFVEACRKWPEQKETFEAAMKGPYELPARPTPAPEGKS